MQAACKICKDQVSECNRGHVYHEVCLSAWFKKKATDCVECRAASSTIEQVTDEFKSSDFSPSNRKEFKYTPEKYRQIFFCYSQKILLFRLICNFKRTSVKNFFSLFQFSLFVGEYQLNNINISLYSCFIIFTLFV